MYNRRHFLAGATLAGLAAPAIVRAQGILRDFPFKLGVAAGDPASDGFVIWTRLAPEPMERHGGMPLTNVPVEWEVASDTGFRDVVAKGTELARPELAHSVHVEVAGLLPDRPYYYRFTAAGERSLRGRARTLPAPGAKVDALKFGVAGCQHFESGFYGAYRHMAREDLAFVYHYGDFIYEYQQNYLYDSGLPIRPVRRYEQRALIDVTDFRAAYAQTLLDIDQQAVRSVHAHLSSFDDHEIINDWVSDIDNWSLDLPGNDPDARVARSVHAEKTGGDAGVVRTYAGAQGAAAARRHGRDEPRVSLRRPDGDAVARHAPVSRRPAVRRRVQTGLSRGVRQGRAGAGPRAGRVAEQESGASAARRGTRWRSR